MQVNIPEGEIQRQLQMNSRKKLWPLLLTKKPGCVDGTRYMGWCFLVLTVTRMSLPDLLANYCFRTCHPWNGVIRGGDLESLVVQLERVFEAREAIGEKAQTALLAKSRRMGKREVPKAQISHDEMQAAWDMPGALLMRAVCCEKDGDKHQTRRNVEAHWTICVTRAAIDGEEWGVILKRFGRIAEIDDDEVGDDEIFDDDDDDDDDVDATAAPAPVAAPLPQRRLRDKPGQLMFQEKFPLSRPTAGLYAAHQAMRAQIKKGYRAVPLGCFYAQPAAAS